MQTIRRAFEVEKFAVKWFGRHSTEAVAAADEKAAVVRAQTSIHSAMAASTFGVALQATQCSIV